MRPRYWIKTQGDGAEGLEAAQIVNGWKSTRTAARNIVLAIRIYAGLLRGDTSLLYETFPFLAGATTSRVPVITKPAAPAPVVESQPNPDDLLDIFGDELEFN